MTVFRPSPAVIQALRERLGNPPIDAVLSERKPDLTGLLLMAAADPAPLGRVLLAAVCRAGCSLLAERHPGASIEVRVPPYAAVQVGFGSGSRHTRGTPPNTVELDGETFAALAAGRMAWADARVRVSGVHADEVSQAFPLLGQG